MLLICRFDNSPLGGKQRRIAFPDSAKSELFSRGADLFHAARAARFAMNPFEKKRFLLPIEVIIALAIKEVVVAVLSYYAIMMSVLLRG
jgi:hypothetical protein